MSSEQFAREWMAAALGFMDAYSKAVGDWFDEILGITGDDINLTELEMD